MKNLFQMFAAVMALTGCATQAPLTPATSVDLPSYMGDWFVIANIPYWAEKNCYGSLERYRLQSDGRIDTTFIANKGSFSGKKIAAKSVAEVTDKRTNSQWQVRFLGGLVKVPLIILHVSPDYRHAVVATPDRKLAWIFSRERTLPANDFKSAKEVLRTQGIDVERLVLVPQMPGRE